MLKVCLLDEVMAKVMIDSLRKQPTFFVVTCEQGSYRSWKTWKVMDFKNFEACKVRLRLVSILNNKDI